MISHSSSSTVLVCYIIGDSLVKQQSESTTFCLTTKLVPARLKRTRLQGNYVSLSTFCKQIFPFDVARDLLMTAVNTKAHTHTSMQLNNTMFMYLEFTYMCCVCCHSCPPPLKAKEGSTQPSHRANRGGESGTYWLWTQ